MSQSEKKIFDSLVKKSGLTQSEYFRKMALGERVFVLGSKEEMKKIYYELNKLGINTNQIAKNLNSNIYIDAHSDIQNLLKNYAELLKVINKLYDRVNQKISRKKK